MVGGGRSGDKHQSEIPDVDTLATGLRGRNERAQPTTPIKSSALVLFTHYFHHHHHQHRSASQPIVTQTSSRTDVTSSRATSIWSVTWPAMSAVALDISDRSAISSSFMLSI